MPSSQFRRPTPVNLRLPNRGLIAIALIQSLLSTAFAQAPALDIERDGINIVLKFNSDTDSYYVVRSGAEPNTVDTPQGIALGSGMLQSLVDSGVLAAPAGSTFYRLVRIPLNDPLDTDEDGINDVLELGTPFLNPLNAADAGLDFDMDGFSNFEELITHQTSAEFSNQSVLPPRLLGLSFQAAKDTLDIAGFRVGTITCVPSVHQPAAVILAPDLPPGVALPDNAAIDLTISLPLDPNQFIDQRNLVSFDGNEANSLAYYAAVDPNGDRTTLEDWKTANNFGQAPTYGPEVGAFYFNEADLGFGRRMFMRWDSERIAYYVVNYANADEAALGTLTDIATVAMEYSPHPVNGGDPYIKFFTFNGNHTDPSRRGDPSVPADSRMTKIDLDGRGPKFQPGMCITCHGGTPRELVAGVYPNLGNTGARFIPFDVDSFTYPTLPGFSRTAQDDAFNQLNQAVLASIPPVKRFTFNPSSEISAAVNIPDNDPLGVDIPLFVSGLSGTIVALDFSFDGKGPASPTLNDHNNGLNHPHVGDLVVKLTSPAGTTITLIDRIGLPDQNPTVGIAGRNFCNVRLDDSAVNRLEDATAGQAPFSGYWFSSQNINPLFGDDPNFTGAWLGFDALAAFFGEDPNGSWILNVSDLKALDTGAVNQWSLRISPTIKFDAVDELVRGWYGPAAFPNANTFDETFVPPGWLTPTAVAEGGDEVYREVIAKSCRACHAQLTDRRPDLDFSSYAQIAGRRETMRSYVFHQGLMPMAKRTFDKFWKSVDTSQAEVLAAWLDEPNHFSYAGPSVSIPDPGQGGPAVLQLTVSGMIDPLKDVDFAFDGGPCSRTLSDLNNGVTHPFVGDLVATLTSPHCNTVTLLYRAGGNGNNLCQMRFDDEVSASLATVTGTQAPFVGSWTPSSPLSAFDGEDPNGTWTLTVDDQAAGNTGSVQHWSLYFNSLGATIGPGAPRAVVIAPTTALYLQPVNLDSSQSLFVGSLLWSFESVPPGSAAVISDPTSATASFTPDQEGTYCVKLTVTNPSGTDSALRDITVENQAPQVSANSNSPVLFPVPIALDGAVSDDGLPIVPGSLTYLWEKASGPGTVTFATPTQEDTSASFTMPGSYVLCLTASDGALPSSVLVPIEVDAALVTVGNAGNGVDPASGRGAVGIGYRIGKYEVTNQQYAAFLNAVAGSADPFELYHPLMGSNSLGGIVRTGSAGAFSYTVKPGKELLPVVFVGFIDAVRYANWLHNGALTGGGTETGAYTLLGGTPLPSNAATFTRQSGASFWIPSADEWYKAAYHQPALLGGDADGYWTYATGSNTPPAASPPPGTPPAANYAGGAAIGGLTTLTSVGAYIGSDSFYGTFDQNGNVWEVMDTITMPSGLRAAGGGGPFNFDSSVNAATTVSVWGFDWQEGTYGFRIAAELGAVGGNLPPVVSAGTNASISPTNLPAILNLSGAVSDDGLPASGSLTAQWTQISAPAGAPAASFSNAGDPTSTVTFQRHGDYVLRLTATDGELLSFAQVTITVLVSFENDIVPMLTTPTSTCVSCHNDGFAGGGLAIGLNSTTPKSCNSIHVQLTSGAGRVNTGNPTSSNLLNYPASGSGGSMPAVGGFGVGSENYQKLLLWIQQGAGNDCPP